MTTEGELKVLLKGLNETVIDLEAFQNDISAGKINVELELKWVSLPQNFEQDVIKWALKKYNIRRTYDLTTKSGAVIGKIDFLENISGSDLSYTKAAEQLGELGFMLSEESLTILQYCEGSDGNAIDAVELLIPKKKKADSAAELVSEYVIEQFGFEKGKFVFDGDDFQGQIPKKFVKAANPYYAVAPAIFGVRYSQACLEFAFPNLSLKRINHRQGIKGILKADPAVYSHTVTDKIKAVEILRTLCNYVI